MTTARNNAIDIKSALEVVRSALLSLRAAGSGGFEGLLRLVLTKLTGIPFRLAASGIQGGMDGDAALRSDSVCFEAKRYSGDVGREAVLTKIADLARTASAADRLWVLGATVEIPAQLADAVRQDGDRNAISTYILDWVASPLPFLAVVVVSADNQAIEFIVDNFDERSGYKRTKRNDLVAAFNSISRHPEFSSVLQKIKFDLDGSKLAFAKANERNARWREEVFRSASKARTILGQALAVKEDQNLPRLREALRADVIEKLRDGDDLVLLGDEGHGKSWLAAQVCADSEGMALFISAEQFDGVGIDVIDELLVDLLIKQAGDVADETLRQRWRHRLKVWKTTPPLASLWVVVDGINQRQSLRWDRLLNGFHSFLAGINGRLIVTVRPLYWNRVVAAGVAFRPVVFQVPEWLPEERNALLSHHGVELDWLDHKTLRTLQNPRLLAVAVRTLPHHEAAAWKGLTTDRLLMEHLRSSQIQNYEDETFLDLTARLSEHARQVLERVKASVNEPPQNFRADSSAVIETRFFRQLDGPGDFYELRGEGLTLALGFTLVDQLWQTHRAHRDLVERVAHLIEPINALDRTADVLFAAVLICALDNHIRFDERILSALLDSFANLQNIEGKKI